MNGWLGIDVAKETLDVALVSERQRTYGQFGNDVAGYAALLRWLKKRKLAECHACLEATGVYGEGITEELYKQGITVSVVNPARVRGYADSQLSRNKTDKLDAYLLADFCRTFNPEAWTPPPPEWRELRALVRHLEDLSHAHQQLTNQMDSGTPSAIVQTHWQTQLALLNEHSQQVKQAITVHLDHYPDLKRQKDLLISIPGIGDLTAARLLAECRSLTAFTNVRQLVAFAGLNPRHHQSGTSICKHTAISHRGSASLRAALYMPAIVAKRHNPVLRRFAQRLLDRGLAPKAVVVAVMRKLLHLAYGVLKSGRPFDPAWLPS